MAQLEACVRSIQLDGLVWGASKLVPVGYGIRKLQIQCVVEDDKVGTDLLEEITKFEEHVSEPAGERRLGTLAHALHSTPQQWGASPRVNPTSEEAPGSEWAVGERP